MFLNVYGRHQNKKWNFFFPPKKKSDHRHDVLNGTEDLFLDSADIKNINSTQQIKFKELTKRFYI